MQKLLKNTQAMIFLIMILFLGAAARIYLLPISSGDQTQFLIPWFEYISANGGVAAVGHDIGDYMPTYYYIMALITYLPIDPIVGIKLVSGIFDVILAFLVMKTVWHFTDSTNIGVLSFSVTFMLPTVILNSAGWGQCDVIFTAFLVACLYYLLKKRDIAAIVCFTVSFVFKLQAIFFAPFLFLLLLKKYIRLKSLLAFPAVYILSIIPAMFAGGDFVRLLTVYFRQPLQYSSLNMVVPNAWSLFFEVSSKPLGQAGVMFAGAVLLIFIYMIYMKSFEMNGNIVLCLATIFSMAVPFLLPHMHERYYYLSDIMSVIFVAKYPKKFWMLLISQFISVQSISPFLFGKETMDLRFLTLLAVIWLYGAASELIKEIKNSSEPSKVISAAN